MSHAFYNIESLRFYSEDEIEIREMMVTRFSSVIRRELQRVNNAWKFFRVEGPMLTPNNFISSSYDADDVFYTQISKANEKLVLRPETTASSYAFARNKYCNEKLPLCVWQVGKSFRVEKSDGATAAKLRFNEFYQQEFQCIYSKTTMADYRSYLIEVVKSSISMFLTNTPIRVVESDRLPEYSESTLDIEVLHGDQWREVASCSIRADYSEDTRVCEIALGLDRLVEIYSQNAVR